MSLTPSSIGAVAEKFGVTVHTLRYYEKIGLLAPISKNSAGRRVYSSSDIERLHFIKRAQRMHFSLKEISALLEVERNSSRQKPQAQKLVAEKLGEIEDSLQDLIILKEDLSNMLNACLSSGEGEDCPIIEGIGKGPTKDAPR
ncbi:MAG: heavy metal-responsive transcriptional regulator [Pseudomonadota bacterium]